MTYDPTTNYGDKDLTFDENLICWKFSELIKNLITLSSDANRQIEIIGCGAAADEMAMDFYTYFTLSAHSYLGNNFLTISQYNSLKELDKFFDTRSGDESLEFWNDFQLSTNSDWVFIRQKAENILEILGMNSLKLIFDRKEKSETIGQEKKLIMQNTKTRLVNKNDRFQVDSKVETGK